MDNHFNALDVLEIAQDIERDGQAFYTKAASFVHDKRAKMLLLELAKWEAKHYEIFGEIKDNYLSTAEVEIVDPDEEASKYLNAFVAGEVFDPGGELEKYFQPDISEAQILNKAIELEKSSIAYYLGLKDMVLSEKGKEKIEEIIREEMRHIRILNERLSELND